MSNARLIIALALMAPYYAAAAADAEPWRLDSAIARIHEVSPQLRAAAATRQAQHALERQAGRWPNPAIELQVDDEVAKSQGAGGAGLRQLAISQAVPISGRLGHQEARAAAQARQAGALYGAEALRQERATAEVFHDLQKAQAHLALAQRRHTAAARFGAIGQARQRAGDLSKLDRLRLSLVREQAHQALTSAEGEYEEVAARLQVLLALDPDVELQVAELGPVPAPQALAYFVDHLQAHPERRQLSHAAAAAQAELHLARARRLGDLQLSLAREKIIVGNQEDHVARLGLKVPLPLWDRKQGDIAHARHQIDAVRQRQAGAERALAIRVRSAHDHLLHLIGQAQHHQQQVLKPAKRIYELTQVSFQAGEVDILDLTTVYETYFDAQQQYQDLLHSAWMELADLRLAAGISLAPSTQP